MHRNHRWKKSLTVGAMVVMPTLFAAGVQPAHAEAVYQFSYTFAGNRFGLADVQITGTVQGVSDGAKVSGINHITMSRTYLGVTTTFDGPLNIIGYYSIFSGDIFRDERQMWFDRDLNNFYISNRTDCNFATDSGCITPPDYEGFLLRDGTGGIDEDAILIDGNTVLSDDSVATNTWSLTFLRDVDPPPSGVPEAGSLFLVLAGLFTLITGRRRERSA